MMTTATQPRLKARYNNTIKQQLAKDLGINNEMQIPKLEKIVINMQVLGVVIPKLEELQQEGAVGQRKITQYTRYVTIALATLQATVLVFLFGTGGGGAFYSAVQAPSVPLLPDGIWPRGYLIIPTLVAGTALLMPQREHIDVPVRESLIVELYSK